MQNYKPNTILYSQSSLDNGITSPNNNSLDNIANSNNPLKNQKGGIKKRIAIYGTIALLVAGATVALNPFSQEEKPTPYTPPAITIPTSPAQTPTEPQTPTETPSSLEDLIPPDGPLSIADIKTYTENAYKRYYEAITASPYNEKMRVQARDCLEKVVDSVVDTIFEDKERAKDELVAFDKTADLYLYGRLLTSDYEEDAENYIEWALKRDKESVQKAFFNGASIGLGTAPGQGIIPGTKKN